MRKENKRALSSLLVILTLPLLQGFSSRETDFYLCQFFSNFLKYSFSNFLSSQPYSNFAIYFPSNLFLLYFSTFGFFFVLSPCPTFSYFLTSALNLPSNSFTNSLAFPRFSSLSHVLLSVVNPFHCTKYLSIPCIFLLFSIFLISHSLLPSTSIGFLVFFFLFFYLFSVLYYLTNVYHQMDSH